MQPRLDSALVRAQENEAFDVSFPLTDASLAEVLATGSVFTTSRLQLFEKAKTFKKRKQSLFLQASTQVEDSLDNSTALANKRCEIYLLKRGVELNVNPENHAKVFDLVHEDSVLGKKSQSIAHHYVREGVARDDWRTSYTSIHDNEADLLTKSLANGEKRRFFIRSMLHHIFPTEGQYDCAPGQCGQ